MIGHISHVVGSFGGFHAVCECGWLGNDRVDREFAETDRSLHVASAALTHEVERSRQLNAMLESARASRDADHVMYATALEEARKAAAELVRPTNGEAPLESEWWRDRIPVLTEAVRTQRWFDVLELALIMSKQGSLELKALWAQYALASEPPDGSPPREVRSHAQAV